MKHKQRINPLTEKIMEIESSFRHSKPYDIGNYTIDSPIMEVTPERVNKRNKAINNSIYLYHNHPNDRVDIIKALTSGTQLPTWFGYDNQLLYLVLENTLSIVKFFNDIFSAADFDVQQEIKDHFDSLKTRSSKLLIREDALKQEIKSLNNLLLIHLKKL